MINRSRRSSDDDVLNEHAIDDRETENLTKDVVDILLNARQIRIWRSDFAELDQLHTCVFDLEEFDCVAIETVTETIFDQAVIKD